MFIQRQKLRPDRCVHPIAQHPHASIGARSVPCYVLILLIIGLIGKVDEPNRISVRFALGRGKLGSPGGSVTLSAIGKNCQSV
jgi:hypothetical protein